MNLLNQEIQAIQYTIQFYKGRIQVLENQIESGMSDFEENKTNEAIEYYNNKLDLLDKELKARLSELK